MELPAALSTLWEDYLRAEAVGHRPTLLSALDRFIEALLLQPLSVRQTWVYEQPTPARHPLLQRVILPILAAGVREGRPGAARLLAACPGSFDQVDLPPPLQSRLALLREALRIDPDDDAARRSLRDGLSRILCHSLHELPSGVLWGMNGADEAQCDELVAIIEEIRDHGARLGEPVDPTLDEALVHVWEYRGRIGG